MMSSQVQIQQQTERQIQKLTPRQLLNARLIELPVLELEDRVKTELLDNIALEEGHERGEADEPEYSDYAETADDARPDAGDPDDPDSHADTTLYDDEDIPIYTSRSARDMEPERPLGDTKSFFDELYSQISDFDMSDKQRAIIEVLIGSLNEGGFIDRTLSGISDDLLFKFNIDATEDEISEAIHILQQFEPAGIGARNLQECLLIQVRRQPTDTLSSDKRKMLEAEQTILNDCFELFTRQDYLQIAQKTGLDADLVKKAIEGISHLNPRPGLALSESSDTGYQAIVPDFIIDTTPDGAINIELNHGEVPELRVSREYIEQLKQYQKQETKLSRTQTEAFEYTRMKVEGARMFIDALKQRQHTLMQTIRAVARLQHDFMLTQDDSQLHTMRLADVSELAHIDISTVSRVRKSKYVLLDGNLYPLDFFFLRSRTNAEGEELQHKEVKRAMRELINSEDKLTPYSDNTLETMLRQRGYNISRRTVAKYRNEMGIAAAQYRK